MPTHPPFFFFLLSHPLVIPAQAGIHCPLSSPTKGDACERSKHAGVCPKRSRSSDIIPTPTLPHLHPAPTLRHSCAGRNPHRPLRFSVRGRECSAAKRAGDARGGAGQNRRSPHRRNPEAPHPHRVRPLSSERGRVRAKHARRGMPARAAAATSFLRRQHAGGTSTHIAPFASA